MKVQVMIDGDEALEITPYVRDILAKTKKVFVSGEEVRRFIRAGNYSVVKEFGRLFAKKATVVQVAKDLAASLNL